MKIGLPFQFSALTYPSPSSPTGRAEKGTAFSFTFEVNARVFQRFQPSPPAPLPQGEGRRLPPSPCGRGRGGVGEGLSRLGDKGFRSVRCTRAFEVEPRLLTLISPERGGELTSPRPVGEGQEVRAGTRHAELYRACQQFESIFLLQLWRAMQRTIPRSQQTLNYEEMFDFTFAEYLSMQGSLGIAEQLYQQLSQHLAESQQKEATP